MDLETIQFIIVTLEEGYHTDKPILVKQLSAVKPTEQQNDSAL